MRAGASTRTRLLRLRPVPDHSSRRELGLQLRHRHVTAPPTRPWRRLSCRQGQHTALNLLGGKHHNRRRCRPSSSALHHLATVRWRWHNRAQHQAGRRCSRGGAVEARRGRESGQRPPQPGSPVTATRRRRPRPTAGWRRRRLRQQAEWGHTRRLLLRRRRRRLRQLCRRGAWLGQKRRKRQVLVPVVHQLRQVDLVVVAAARQHVPGLELAVQAAQLAEEVVPGAAEKGVPAGVAAPGVCHGCCALPRGWG